MEVAKKMKRNMVIMNITATIAESIKKMQSERVENALIFDGLLFKGLITDSQIWKEMADSKKDPTKVKISELLTKEIVTISPKSTLHEAVLLMWMHRSRKLPVFDGGMPIGIISTSEIAEHALACSSCMDRIFGELERAEKKTRINFTDKIDGEKLCGVTQMQISRVELDGNKADEAESCGICN